MLPKDITVTQDETFMGGLCLVAIEPVSNYILVEHTAEARDQDKHSQSRLCWLTQKRPRKGACIRQGKVRETVAA
jgi:hypothetical protein